MSLPHLLLGLLTDEPHTGYDLARAIHEDIEPVWRAELSQIYPQLARLRRAGFVVLRVLGPRRGPRRNVYRITAAGRRELRRWLSEPAPAPRMKDEGLARIAFLDVLSPAERHQALVRQEKTVTEEIRRLQSSPRPAGFRGEARRGAIDRLEGIRQWLRGLSGEKTAAAQEQAGGPKKR